MKNKQNPKIHEKGITLIALIITIILLLILAGVTLKIVIDNNFVDKTQTAVNKYSEAQARENLEFTLLNYKIGQLTGEEKTLQEYLEESNIAVSNVKDGIYTVAIKGYEFKLNEKTFEIEGEGSKVEQPKPTEPEEQEYTLILIVGDYIDTVTGAGTYKVGEKVTIKATLQDNETGYTNTFTNWTSSNENFIIPNNTSIETEITMPAENITLTANGEKIPKYTLNFDANGGTVETTSIEVTYNEKFGDLPIPTRAGYNFIGWFTESSDGTEITKDTTVTITSDKTIYARWKITPLKYTYTDASGRGVKPKIENNNTKISGDGPINIKIELTEGIYTLKGSVKNGAIEFTNNNGERVTMMTGTVDSKAYNISESGKISAGGNWSIEEITITSTGEQVTFELVE